MPAGPYDGRAGAATRASAGGAAPAKADGWHAQIALAIQVSKTYLLVGKEIMFHRRRS
jgi:hypothetical protein